MLDSRLLLLAGADAVNAMAKVLVCQLCTPSAKASTKGLNLVNGAIVLSLRRWC